MPDKLQKVCYDKDVEQLKTEIAALNDKEIRLLLFRIRAMKGERKCVKRESN